MSTPNRQHRRSVRLRGYNYAQEGAYFVTLCVQNRACLFGTIDSGELILNDAGSMVNQAWADLPEYCIGVELDEHIVMPNHVHGIIVLSGDSRAGDAAVSLGEVVKRLKTWTMSCYSKGVREAGWRRFHERLWQRNYYDRIIRNERELEGIRHYIHFNPLGWEDDDYHPTQVGGIGDSVDPLRIDGDWTVNDWYQSPMTRPPRKGR